MSFYSVEDTFPLILDYMAPDKDLFEGGIYSGNTLKRLADGSENLGKPFRKIWAADSFAGLPEDTPGLFVNPDWPKGAFNICEDRGLKSVEEGIAYVQNHVQRDNVIYVPGFFEDSLTEGLAKNIGQENISYLHVDVDIHKSSLQLLNFVLKYNLLCVGCLIRFDDYNSTGNNAGERLAWSQVTNKYNITSHRLADNVFQVITHDRP